MVKMIDARTIEPKTRPKMIPNHNQPNGAAGGLGRGEDAGPGIGVGLSGVNMASGDGVLQVAVAVMVDDDAPSCCPHAGS